MIGDNEVFVYDNFKRKMPFPSYKASKMWDSPKDVPVDQKKWNGSEEYYSDLSSDLQMDLEEICISLHLVCIICRAVILGYNALEKQDRQYDGRLLKFSELLALLSSGLYAF